MQEYPATYTDVHGSEKTVITNDGKTLRMVVRGVEFSGISFDLLSPSAEIPQNQLETFTLNSECLCACRIEWLMAVPIFDLGNQSIGELQNALILGNPQPNGCLDKEDLFITLVYKDQRFSGKGTSGWFEDELLDVQSKLPDGIYMRACINCLYSDYSVYGHCLFGDMLCFRNAKAKYLEVRTKLQYLTMPVGPERDVQETFLCPEFERRVPGTGYRG
jgi:hypothetical protein